MDTAVWSAEPRLALTMSMWSLYSGKHGPITRPLKLGLGNPLWASAPFSLSKPPGASSRGCPRAQMEWVFLLRVSPSVGSVPCGSGACPELTHPEAEPVTERPSAKGAAQQGSVRELVLLWGVSYSRVHVGDSETGCE